MNNKLGVTGKLFPWSLVPLFFLAVPSEVIVVPSDFTAMENGLLVRFLDGLAVGRFAGLHQLGLVQLRPLAQGHQLATREPLPVG